MAQNFNDKLKEIIKILLDEPEWDRRIVIPDEAYLRDVLAQVIILDCNTAGKKIDELKEDIERPDNRYVQMQPYFLIFISYAYSLLSLGTDSLHYAQRAYPYKWNNDWRQALSYWFLGLVYLQNNCVEEARNELTSAQNKLERYCEISQDKYVRTSVCRNYINEIKKIIEEIRVKWGDFRTDDKTSIYNI